MLSELFVYLPCETVIANLEGFMSVMEFKDHLGNNRVVVNKTGTVEQVLHYYPYGGTFGTSSNSSHQRYKYNGKEFDRTHGLDWYDYGARYQSPDLGRFTTMDPLAEKYYNLSPYTYCGNNPVNAVDFQGDSTAVLNMGYGLNNQHIALLVQNENNRWEYYSFNGTNIYNFTNGFIGGGPINNLGEIKFDSPQEFLDSDYNTYESHPKTRMGKNEINGYGFSEAYILPTTPDQDNSIRESFNSKIEEGYSLFTNHCSHAVQEALKSAGIKVSIKSYSVENNSYYDDTPYLPGNAFMYIKTQNDGKLIYRKK